MPEQNNQILQMLFLYVFPEIQPFQNVTLKHPRSIEWVIKFNGLSGDSGQQGPYSSYKLCNHNLYIGIIIFPHIDNKQPTVHNQL